MQDYNRIQRALNRDMASYFDAIDNNELEQDMIDKCYKEINADRELLNRIINTSTIQQFTYTELQLMIDIINIAGNAILDKASDSNNKQEINELIEMSREFIKLKNKTKKYLDE